LLREVVAAVVPAAACEHYMPFARELYATFHRPPYPDFTLRTKRVVRKWFERGLSGKLLWRIGERLLAKLYPAAGLSKGTN
jgi:hypothetical protein